MQYINPIVRTRYTWNVNTHSTSNYCDDYFTTVVNNRVYSLQIDNYRLGMNMHVPIQIHVVTCSYTQVWYQLCIMFSGIHLFRYVILVWLYIRE